MGPGFHRLYAGRLAWRYRLGLALGLALLGFLHPLWALVSPLALLLPARPFEGRALRAIARKSLAYPTALAYGEERLWQEAKRVRVDLPPFPAWLLLAYLLALSLALAPALWKGPEGGAWPSLGAEPAKAPRSLQEAPSRGEQPQKGAKEGETAKEGRPQSPSPGEQPQKGAKEVPSPEGEKAQEGKAQGPSPEAPASRREAGRPASSGPQGTPGLGPQGPSLKPPPPPSGPKEGLLSPEGQGEASPLPAPWPQGQPPEKVRRGVEVYLERTPLAPEDRELLRRYFGLP